jgi:hypothetical protein
LYLYDEYKEITLINNTVICKKVKIKFTKRNIYDKINYNKSIRSEQNVRNIDF